MKTIIPSARSRADSGWRRVVAGLAGALLLVGLLGGAVALERVSPNAVSGPPADADHPYRLSNVWAIHLKFAPDQWEAMEPRGGGNPFLGGGRGGASGGRPGGGGNGNVERTLPPVFMSQGDLNRDGRISREEFTELGQRWFTTWGTNGTGQLDEGQVAGGGFPGGFGGGGGLGGMFGGPLFAVLDTSKDSFVMQSEFTDGESLDWSRGVRRRLPLEVTTRSGAGCLSLPALLLVRPAFLLTITSALTRSEASDKETTS